MDPFHYHECGRATFDHGTVFPYDRGGNYRGPRDVTDPVTALGLIRCACLVIVGVFHDWNVDWLSQFSSILGVSRMVIRITKWH